MTPRIDLDRLVRRLETFNRIGALPGGGNCRLALSDEDRAGRDLLVQWMRGRGMAVTVDAIGNIIGVRPGREDCAPVMLGSHIDTVGTGGRYDGLYGVLAGFEACEALDDAQHVTRRPLALVAFTNEEGSRFAPYAMGSLVYVGGLALDAAYAIRGIDGASVGEELRRIGYAGEARPGWLAPRAYLELHIEQGPVLEDEGLVIGAVERAVLTVDLRNTDAGRLREAERGLLAFLDRLAGTERVSISTRSLARFDPVAFPDEMVSLIEATARKRGLPSRRLPSGAGHDAQMMARLCPAGIIFVPSVGGLSHNIGELTKPEHLEAGAAVLLDAVLRLADED